MNEWQSLHVIYFDVKTTRIRGNQQTLRNVFESIISMFQMAYTQNEHITNDEQSMVFRGKCPFHMIIQPKPGKYGIKLWLAAEAKNFYACNKQVYNGKSDGEKKKKLDL
jgi:hypothetical protein